MRKFIRHPVDMPIEYSVANPEHGGRPRMTNVSQGGLCFHSDTYLKPGTEIHVVIPVRDPPFEADGVVVWSYLQQGQYEIGVELDATATRFALRMVEQICYIEHYRKHMLEQEGRYLSREQAAAEWIAKYAEDFPIVH